jgi:hypothetical protein
MKLTRHSIKGLAIIFTTIFIVLAGLAVIVTRKPEEYTQPPHMKKAIEVISG